MFKVVKQIPDKRVMATTSTSLLESRVFKGSDIQLVRDDFHNIEDAEAYIEGIYKSNPISEWKYSVVEY